MSQKSRMERLNEAFEKHNAARRRCRYTLGFDAGRQWAMKGDNVKRLGPLQRLRDDENAECFAYMFRTPGNDKRDAITTFIKFALLLHPDWKRLADWVAPQQWRHELKKQTECDVTDPKFMHGFADGALSVLDESSSKEADD